jgi:hypothetical protein
MSAGRWGILRNDPGETRVAAEESFVDDQACDVCSLGAGFVGDGDQVAAANDNEADEEAWKHRTGPESTSKFLHVENSWNGAEQ